MLMSNFCLAKNYNLKPRVKDSEHKKIPTPSRLKQSFEFVIIFLPTVFIVIFYYYTITHPANLIMSEKIFAMVCWAESSLSEAGKNWSRSNMTADRTIW